MLAHNQSVPTDSEIEAGAKAYRIAHSLQSGRRNLAGIVFSVCGGDIESLPSNFPSSFSYYVVRLFPVKAIAAATVSVKLSDNSQPIRE